MFTLNEQFQKLFTKKMTRKDFLRHMLLLALSIMGLSRFIQYIGRDNYKKPSGPNSYGKNLYGGKGLKRVSAQQRVKIN